ncbi:hypothetical protein N7931_08040 [Catenovulum sp. 2E275]|uniref:hypothetical protein n=1 Tax=Catenovulum sp. 2E275 TaxID=2980497 RepID=UPI0021CDEDC6|nr:hypothetical protein [Catenovulum sp. 2E275]MCU4675586.1 hypothetical protein [Catenovulum sp. 2E275]
MIKRISRPFTLLLISMAFTPALNAEEIGCIQANERTAQCPHYIIRSIQTENPKYKHKAICICLTDFDLQTTDQEKLNKRLEQAQQKFELNREDLMELITGRS